MNCNSSRIPLDSNTFQYILKAIALYIRSLSLNIFIFTEVLRRSGCDRGPSAQVQFQNSVQVILHDDQRGLPVGFRAAQAAGGTETGHLTILVQSYNAQRL